MVLFVTSINGPFASGKMFKTICVIFKVCCPNTCNLLKELFTRSTETDSLFVVLLNCVLGVKQFEKFKDTFLNVHTVGWEKFASKHVNSGVLSVL